MRFALLVISAICLAFPAFAQQPAATTVPVGVARAELKPISKTSDFVGRVESINRVEIMARVTGYLEDVKFKEGDLIKTGAPLYLIEQGLFKAAVGQARRRPRAQQGRKDVDRDPAAARPGAADPAGRDRGRPGTRRWPPISRPRARS